MPGNANPGARQRAEHELRADPARSDHLIAQLAACTPQRVSVWRRALERAAAIPHIEPAARTPRPRLLPFRRRRHPADAAAAIDQLSVVKIPAPRRIYAPPGPAEIWCCTPAWHDGGWQHDRACVLRLSGAR